MTADASDPCHGGLAADAEAFDFLEDTEDLALREEFIAELQASLDAVARGEPTIPLEEVARMHRLT